MNAAERSLYLRARSRPGELLVSLRVGESLPTGLGFTPSAHCLLQRRGRGLPRLHLLGRQRIDLVAGQRLHLGAAGRLEVGPRRGDLHRPLAGAVVVDHLLLRGRHAVVLGLVHRPDEHGRVERHVHVVLHHLVDAEQEHRAPREDDGVGHAALQHVARLGRRGLHVGAAQHGDHLADRALAGRIFMPLMSSGATIFLRAVIGRRDRGRRRSRNACPSSPCAAYLRYQASSAAVPLLPSAKVKGIWPTRDHREAAGLVAGIDVGHVGDAVARHVVVVERLAELLGRKDRGLDRAARCLGRCRRPRPWSPAPADARAAARSTS